MHTHVRKRNGSVDCFQIEKIARSITRANQTSATLDQATIQRLTSIVVHKIGQTNDSMPTTNEISSIIGEVLCKENCHNVSQAYADYYQHKYAERITNLVDLYVNNTTWKVNENSNTGYSLQGLNNHISSEIIKNYWLAKIYPADIRQAALSGDIHIHDLQSLSTYCVGWDLQDILRVGFQGAPDKVESKPSKHLGAALGQLVNFFYTVQGESAGAQAISNFDTLLAPFIRYDKLNYSEIKQLLQEFMFNMNIPTRVGFQTPFTNITLDLFPPSTLANEHIIIGGQAKDETYGEFQEEMNIFNKALIDVLTEGDAKGRVFTFPIPTYNITKDFDWDNPVLDGLWKMTAKYGIPYFSNFVNSDMNPEDARSMCCRLRLDNRELRKRGGGLFGANPLTGSVGVVTINMPRLGHRATNEDEFFNYLAKVMDLAKESLEIKRKFLEESTDRGLYPYSRFYLRHIKERNGKYWTNHFSTIGLVGMNEACINLFGCSIADEQGFEFAKRVLDFMRNRIQRYQEETGNIYNLEATPAESTSYNLAKKDKRVYPGIKVANEEEYSSIKEAPFYTNSSQLPIDHTDDLFEMLDHQDELQIKYTGGTVVHIFVGEKISNPGAVKALVKTICHKYRLPYFTITPTFSICPTHGYMAGNIPTCPQCGSTNNVYSRIVGYLRPVSQWNISKKAEFGHRKTYGNALSIKVRTSMQESCNE